MADTAHPLAIGGHAIRQIDGLFSLNDLHRASGGEKKHEPHQFLRNEQTKALIAEIQTANSRFALKAVHGGASPGTYACRELVIAYAAWISAAFHLQVIRVFLAASAPSADPGFIQAAAEAASQVACDVYKRVFSAMLSGKDDWKYERWLLTFITDSKFAAPACIKLIERNAFVLPIERFADGINDTVFVDDHVLTGIASACLRRLHYRAERAAKLQAKSASSPCGAKAISYQQDSKAVC